MMQIQINVSVVREGARVDVHFLKREDATADEEKIAKAIEQMLLGCIKMVGEQPGVKMTMRDIGPANTPQEDDGTCQKTT